MPVTPQEVCEFAEKCIEYNLTKNQVNCFLGKININFAKIEDEDNASQTTKPKTMRARLRKKMSDSIGTMRRRQCEPDYGQCEPDYNIRQRQCEPDYEKKCQTQ